MAIALQPMSLEERFAPLDDARARFVSKVYSGLTLSLGVATAACIIAYQAFSRMAPQEVYGIWSILRFAMLGMLLVTWFVTLRGIFGWIWLMAFVAVTGVTLAPIMMIYMRTSGGTATVAAALG